ncbi:hypothetical protein J5N97_013470 [Dioscorea zingiberensis]|uniref:Uncharacterized protein n=1 Tax=Dioscorea zingiberensis TaxID=325984 RepID=A0A9D5CQT3_9LILI|nr:hypothetical protein J5N97_013470 [Dioscorea zingiberensis]
MPPASHHHASGSLVEAVEPCHCYCRRTAPPHVWRCWFVALLLLENDATPCVVVLVRCPHATRERHHPRRGGAGSPLLMKLLCCCCHCWIAAAELLLRCYWPITASR